MIDAAVTIGILFFSYRAVLRPVLRFTFYATLNIQVVLNIC